MMTNIHSDIENRIMKMIERAGYRIDELPTMEEVEEAEKKADWRELENISIAFSGVSFLISTGKLWSWVMIWSGARISRLMKIFSYCSGGGLARLKLQLRKC